MTRPKPDSTSAMGAPAGWPLRAGRRDIRKFSEEAV
jgi:hypothetical protein